MIEIYDIELILNTQSKRLFFCIPKKNGGELLLYISVKQLYSFLISIGIHALRKIRDVCPIVYVPENTIANVNETNHK